MAAVSVLGNVLAGDRHVVSPCPDLLCLVAAVLLLSFGLAYNQRNSTRLQDRRTAWHGLLTAAGTFAARYSVLGSIKEAVVRRLPALVLGFCVLVMLPVTDATAQSPAIAPVSVGNLMPAFTLPAC